MTGLEPANGGTTNHCLNQLGHTRLLPILYLLVFYFEYVRVFEIFMDILISWSIKVNISFCNKSKIIKKILGNDTDWYLLRYQLIKHLHSQESNIRSEVSKNQQYFAYLLKIELTDLEFEKLLQKNLEQVETFLQAA